MDKNAEWGKRPESNRNRFGPSGVVAMFITITRQEHVWAQKPGSDDSAGACRPPKERAAGNREPTSPSVHAASLWMSQAQCGRLGRGSQEDWLKIV